MLVSFEGFSGFENTSPIEKLSIIKNYVSKKIPAFTLELTLSFSGEFRIVQAFASVFDVVYYAAAQYMTASPDYPLPWETERVSVTAKPVATFS